MQYANYQPYPYYQNHMQSPQEIKKAHDLKTLQKKSSGLGFYILTYFLSMNIIVVGITFLLTVSTMLNTDISNFDTETLTQYIMSKLTSGPVFLLYADFRSCRLGDNHRTDIFKTKQNAYFRLPVG